MKNAVLLELGGSHAECLHTQIHYLAANGYDVHLICDKRVWSQIEEKHLLKGFQVHNLPDKNIFRQLISIFRIHFYVRRHRISHLIINTLESTIIRNSFLVSFPKKLNCTAILHNAQKLVSGKSLHRIVGKKVKKFFVLSEYIRRNFQSQTHFKLSVFYPIYFPKFEFVTLEKSPGEIWITIPGSVEPQRRDYAGLLKELMKKTLHANIKLIFLGHLDVVKYPEIDNLLRQTNLWGTQIICFTNFVENNLFHSYIAQSDLILPLMHPSANGKNDFYGDSRISGSFNLSFAYKIPMLIEQSMAMWDDLQGSCFFYQKEDIIHCINSFANRKDEIENLHRSMKINDKYDENLLQKHYIEFIES